MMHGNELKSFWMGRSAGIKARAPHLTAAKNMLKKAEAHLVRRHGGDTLMIESYDKYGERCSALVVLQKLQPVTLRMMHCTRESTDWLDPGEYVFKGEITISLGETP